MKHLYQSRVGVHYQSEQSEQSDEELYSRKNKAKNALWPRFIKNDMELINPDTIIINISRTQYEVVEEVAEELGWQVETSKKSQKWDIMWIDSHIEAHDLFKLHQHQKISHFPAIYVLTKKNFLGRSLMKMSRNFPQQYQFFPSTWSIPADLTDLMRQDQLSKKSGEPDQYYIYKPQAMAQGKGIKIYNSIDKLKNKTGIIQVYVNNPLLIENLKFDLRIYVLILGYDPLRVFIYDEGLARFATQRYQPVGKKNIKDVYMHLTNYAINKNNKNFIFNKSEKEMDKGHKRSLSAIFKYLEGKGVDIVTLKKKIDEMIIKTLIVGQPMISHTYSLAQADSSYNDICFQILGFDVLINSNFQPILLQVNHTPSFKTQTPLDKSIKKNLIKDTLILLNVNTQNKRQKVNKKKQFLEMRSQRKLVKLSIEEKEILRIKKWKEREQYQNCHCGGYRKIFPVKEEFGKYQKMIDHANRIFNQHYGFKNKQIQKIYQPTTSRPHSFQKSNPDLGSLPSPTKPTDLRYSKTTVLCKQKSLQKFPNINMNVNVNISMKLRNSEKIRNFSGCLGEIQESKKESLKEEYKINNKTQISSPTKKVHRILKNSATEIDRLEKEISYKGSFLAPKLIDLNQIRQSKQSISQQSSPIKIRQVITQSMPPSFPIPIPIPISKTKKIDEIPTQAIHKLPNKICNYSQLLNLAQSNKISLNSNLSANLSETLKANRKYKLPFALGHGGSSKQKDKDGVNKRKLRPLP